MQLTGNSYVRMLYPNMGENVVSSSALLTAEE